MYDKLELTSLKLGYNTDIPRALTAAPLTLLSSSLLLVKSNVITNICLSF